MRRRNDNEPSRIAATVRYRKGEGPAPVVSEIGGEETAELMARIAKRYQIPVVNDPELARQLAAVGRKQAIPAGLYEPVARILIACKTMKAQ